MLEASGSLSLRTRDTVENIVSRRVGEDRTNVEDEAASCRALAWECLAVKRAVVAKV